MTHKPNRRELLKGVAAIALTGACGSRAQATIATRPIGGADERIPALGMGTWLTFDVAAEEAVLEARTKVLAAFFAGGGTLIDSSPMYGNAEDVVGRCLARLGKTPVFAASKVWKYGRDPGREALALSRQRWGVPRFDLLQIHNMLDWQTHLETLVAMRDAGQLRYIGITTSHGRRHREFGRVMRTQPQFDTFQFTYNVTHRDAEQHLLPAAQDMGKAVIINRPLDGGRLFERVASLALPGFAQEIECTSWAQIFLKFVISHPAVTCAIPATRRVDHMLDNMGALRGPLPDAELRRRIVQAVNAA